MTNSDSQPLPKLILTANDVLRIPHSDINRIRFPSQELETVARRLHEIAVLERRAENELRVWRHDQEACEQSAQEIEAELLRAKTELYDLFLTEHDYPNRLDLILSLSDVYAHQGHEKGISELPLRRGEKDQYLLHIIAMVFRLEQELNNTLTNWSRYGESERRAMITDTGSHLESNKRDLIEALIGQ